MREPAQGKRLLGIGPTLAPTPDTGQVVTPVASSTTTPCMGTASVVGHLGAQTLCSNVTMAVSPGSSTSTASVATATIGVPGLPTITLQGVTAISSEACAAWTAKTTIAKLTIGGTVIDVSNVQPNTAINAGVATIILNEQTATTGPDSRVGTVNGVHVVVNTLLAKSDVVPASATADLHNCG